MIFRSLYRSVQMGIRSLMMHKMRSVLTMLGIIFGVCSVIAMLAIGEGASHEALQKIKQLGSANVIIRSVKPPQGSTAGDNKRIYTANYGLKLADVEIIRETFKDHVRRTLAKRVYRDTKVWHDGAMVICRVVATEPHHEEMSPVELLRGRFLTERDMDRADNVCVVTDTLAHQLFSYKDPLGERIKVGKQVFRVVGVLRETGTVEDRQSAGDTGKEALDSNIYVPLTAGHARLGIKTLVRFAGGYTRERVELSELVVEFRNEEEVEATVPALRRALDLVHSPDEVEIIVPRELLRHAEETARIFKIVLGSIASISLLVGGIGIMNIMLATVTERTREIGIRRALGARKQQVVAQFLIETVVLAVIGGLIGVAIGVLVPQVVEHYTQKTTIVTLQAVLAAFGISVLVGIVFGVYPARRAADLDPIEALRHT